MVDSITGRKVAEIKISYINHVPPSERAIVSSSRAAYELIKQAEELRENIDYKEYFFCLYLNRSNHCLAMKKISEGGTSGTVADPKNILQGALKVNASSIILIHNHPSGNLTPSEADTKLTEKIKNAAKFHDFSVVDHLIVSSENYYSFADNGLI